MLLKIVSTGEKKNAAVFSHSLGANALGSYINPKTLHSQYVLIPVLVMVERAVSASTLILFLFCFSSH